jgi:hypothetical protein
MVGKETRLDQRNERDGISRPFSTHFQKVHYFQVPCKAKSIYGLNVTKLRRDVTCNNCRAAMGLRKLPD